MNRILWTAALSALPVLAAATKPGDGFECLIEPSQVVDVRSSVEGLIAAVQVKRGDRIQRGQALVQLHSEAERAALETARYRAKMTGQIASARNRVQYTTAKLARLSQMQAENFVSVQARDEAEAERRVAEADLLSATENQELARLELKRAQEQFAMRTLTAPFNGVVLDRMLHPGDLAEAGSGRKPVLRVAQIDPLKVDIVLPQALAGSVKPGMRVVVKPRVGGGRHAANVAMVDPVIDAASGTFVARLEMPNPGHAIAGGTRCSAEIEGVAPLAPAGLPAALAKPAL